MALLLFDVFPMSHQKENERRYQLLRRRANMHRECNTQSPLLTCVVCVNYITKPNITTSQVLARIHTNRLQEVRRQIVWLSLNNWMCWNFTGRWLDKSKREWERDVVRAKFSKALCVINVIMATFYQIFFLLLTMFSQDLNHLTFTSVIDLYVCS